MRISRWLSLALVVVLIAPTLEAQTPAAPAADATVVPRKTIHWSSWDALGYAGLGGGLGAGITWAAQGGWGNGAFFLAAAGGTLVGAVTGAGIGSKAEGAAKRGEAV